MSKGQTPKPRNIAFLCLPASSLHLLSFRDELQITVSIAAVELQGQAPARSQSPTNMAGSGIEPLPLSQCGLYSLVTDEGKQQWCCNAFTGEMASIDRSAEMVELGIWYDIEYSVGGWAYLSDAINDEKHWVADMVWSKTVVRHVAQDRLFMQDRTATKSALV